MRFSLVDRIVELHPGERIVALKTVSLSEEYLQDHFPLFPVLPGVFMLEAMTQASAWLIRASEDFAHSVVTLKEARNVKYANFLSPGQTLRIEAEIQKQDDQQTKLKVEGTVDGKLYVSGRLVVERYNLSDSKPNQEGSDNYVKCEQRKMFALLNRT
ncbi:MAG: beta-hydroxyacyl-ACP dehydratase [Planctomycetales bacterium]|nr:beta-hydroxyacyl-ACP dehydratase [Planctomycetales bacterium]